LIIKLFATQSIYISISVVNYIFTDSRKLRETRFAYFSSYRGARQNLLRKEIRSGKPGSFFSLRFFLATRVKKTVSELSVLSLSYV